MIARDEFAECIAVRVGALWRPPSIFLAFDTIEGDPVDISVDIPVGMPVENMLTVGQERNKG